MYQRVILVGNLGGDPEMRYMPDGTAVTNFSLATNRKWKNSEGQLQEETTWFRISVWGRQAETANQYLAKGRQCLIEGVLTPDKESGNPRMYQRQDGSWGASFEVRADVVRFLSGGNGESGNGGGASAPSDDIPF